MDAERSLVRSSVVELKGYSRSIRLPALSIASAICPSLLWIISRINSISTTAFMSLIHRFHQLPYHPPPSDPELHVLSCMCYKAFRFEGSTAGESLGTMANCMLPAIEPWRSGSHSMNRQYSASPQTPASGSCTHKTRSANLDEVQAEYVEIFNQIGIHECQSGAHLQTRSTAPRPPQVAPPPP